jgi:branched-chain amino acid transport system ATP-binding protein
MLEVNGVNSFYGKAQVLNDLNFTVDRGTVVALLGRNGAGKTTTMKSIMQLVRPRQGKIIYQGQDITGWPSHKVARNGLGYVPEERRIFTQLTVLENLEVGRQPPRDGCTTWTEDMVFDLFPNLAERRHILLDEPSEGIAPVIVEQMARVILQLKAEGLTVLLSEQNLHFAQAVADGVVIIEHGTQKFVGTLAALQSQPEIRDQYLSV